VSVIEIKLLRWTSGDMRKGKMKNEDIPSKLDVQSSSLFFFFLFEWYLLIARRVKVAEESLTMCNKETGSKERCYST